MPEGEAAPKPLTVDNEDEPAGAHGGDHDENDRNEQDGQELDQVPGVRAPVPQTASGHRRRGLRQQRVEPAAPWEDVEMACTPRTEALTATA